MKKFKRKKKKIKETKKGIDENLQKIEEIKLVLNNSQVDTFLLLSMIANLKDVKVDLNPSTNKLFDPIALWLNKPVHTWKLLYKLTKANEKTTQSWHKQCDGKGPTVTIIWANEGYVFGGYTNVPWASTGNYKESKESFLFSLTDGKNRKPYQCLPFQRFGYAVYHGMDRIAWGSNHDLGIFLPNASYSNIIGSVYKVPDGFNGQSFLAGSYTNWKIEEIETYLV